MEDFVDGYWIVADENDYRLTYFYTSEFVGTEKRNKQAFKRPLIATTSYMLVRNKLLKWISSKNLMDVTIYPSCSSLRPTCIETWN